MSDESRELILLEQISRIVVVSGDIQDTLDRINGLLADWLGMAVSSVFLKSGDSLVMKSTHGLNHDAVDSTSMALTEGLVGLTCRTGMPVFESDAPNHPAYKYFPGIGEEEFTTFFGVPIVHLNNVIGVLTAQSSDHRVLTQDQERMLVTAANQLSLVIAHSDLCNLDSAKTSGAKPPFYKGLPVCPGVAMGVAFPLADEMGLTVFAEQHPRSPEEEAERFERAVNLSVRDVEALTEKVADALGEADAEIFQAHRLLIEDRGFQDKVRAKIDAGEGAAHAVAEVARGYVAAFKNLKDPYLRERAADVKDIAQRILGHLGEEVEDDPETFDEPTIVVAGGITPSRLVRLMQPNLIGVALLRGGSNSHAAILSRSAGIPVVAGFEEELPPVEEGVPVILDGNSGLFYIDPSEEVSSEYTRLAEEAGRERAELISHVKEPSVTLDGVEITLMGNVSLVSDVGRVVENGGAGVGLCRTEFPFLIRRDFPSEDEQVAIYEKIISGTDGGAVTFRTLDVGGDKPLPYLPLPEEENPQLGYRSIRLCLDREEIFRTQLRALLRASAAGNLRIMFPMVATLAELRKARYILGEERSLLETGGVEVGNVEVGAMIEVPSAAFSVDKLSALAEFFSIGTNDLAQYLLAVDRSNMHVASLYDPLDPSVLGVIDHALRSAKEARRPISVCGEMAGNTLGAAALIAIGFTELSMSAAMLPRVRRLVQTVNLGRLKALVPRLLRANSNREVRYLLKGELTSQGVADLIWAER